MSVEIMSLWGDLLYESKTASTVKEATVEAVSKRADLSGANLSGADLSGADLRSADIDPRIIQPLLMLYAQTGPIRAYKCVKEDGTGPWNGGKYEVGKSYSVDDANLDACELCSKGINVGTLSWVLQNKEASHRVLIVEFKAEDIACIPWTSDGKFRLHRCDVVGKLEL